MDRKYYKLVLLLIYKYRKNKNNPILFKIRAISVMKILLDNALHATRYKTDLRHTNNGRSTEALIAFFT